jgi:dienelactone hydrolase
MADIPHSRAVAGGRIPLVYIEPAASPSAPRRLCIWQPGFSGAKEAVLPRLQDLAADGFVALCFDAPDHGERLVDADAQALGRRVRSNLRKYFWEILRDHAREFSIVIDWAIEALGVDPLHVAVGGNSAGGDAAVAAAGLDRRITAVATIVSTPDWLRPGSMEPPGQPDLRSQACFDDACPMTNLAHYRLHQPAIAFHCGAEDAQVPPEAALRFRQALSADYGEASTEPGPAALAAGGERLQVVLHAGFGHDTIPSAEKMTRQFLRKYAMEIPVRGPKL